MRERVWKKLIIPPLKSYDNYVNKVELKEIDLDLERTIPSNKHEKKILGKLKVVLNALA